MHEIGAVQASSESRSFAANESGLYSTDKEESRAAAKHSTEPADMDMIKMASEEPGMDESEKRTTLNSTSLSVTDRLRTLSLPRRSLPPVPPRVKRVSHFLWEDFTDLFGRIACLLVVMYQGATLDYYLIAYNSDLFYGWLLSDVISLGFISWSLWTSYLHFLQTRRKGRPQRKEKIPAFVSWGVYSIALISRVAIIYKHVAHKLTYADHMGPNMLKTALACTAIVYILFVLCHHDAKPFSARNTYISFLSGAVTMDIFDSITILDVLFTLESKIILPFEFENALLGFACINLFLPTFALLKLNNERFGKQQGDVTIRMMHTVFYLLFVNIPYMVMRIRLYHLQQNISVFLIKNCIGIFGAIRWLYYECARSCSRQKRRKSGSSKSEKITTAPRAASADGDLIGSAKTPESFELNVVKAKSEENMVKIDMEIPMDDRRASKSMSMLDVPEPTYLSKKQQDAAEGSRGSCKDLMEYMIRAKSSSYDRQHPGAAAAFRLRQNSIGW